MHARTIPHSAAYYIPHPTQKNQVMGFYGVRPGTNEIYWLLLDGPITRWGTVSRNLSHVRRLIRKHLGFIPTNTEGSKVLKGGRKLGASVNG